MADYGTVIYNGSNEVGVNCKSPDQFLTVGKKYQVIGVHDIGFQTNLYVWDHKDGMLGPFTSTNFTNFVQEAKPIYMANSFIKPEAGMQCYPCSRIEFENGVEKLVFVKTSEIKSVIHFDDSVYKVYTENSVYYVHVIAS